MATPRWRRTSAALAAAAAARAPRRGGQPAPRQDGYLPLQQGVTAILPHVDDLLARHSTATFADLAAVIGRA